MNPELLRNLWLQFSPQRLLAPPLILGAIFALAFLGSDGDWSVVGYTADIGYAIIAYLLGSRRAVNALADEIAAGTWDGQRMSAIGPWTMAWGKLAGGTAHVWYGAAWCLLAFAASELMLARGGALPLALLDKVGGAVLVQTVALLLALVIVGKGRRFSRRSTAFAQGGALLIGLFGISHALVPSLADRMQLGDPVTISWYGIALSAADFIQLTQWLLLGWALLGAYRLMAAELQVRQWPWGWLAFSLFLIAYYQGLPLDGAAEGSLARVLQALLIALPLYYAALFAQSNDIVRYRWLLHDLGQGAWRRALPSLPLWAPAFALAAATALAAGLLSHGRSPADVLERQMPGALMGEAWLGGAGAGGMVVAVAVILFMLRDLGIILLLNFADRPKAPDLTAALYLLVLYGVGSGLVLAVGAVELLPLFIPGASGHALTAIGAPAIELAAVAFLLRRRWIAAAGRLAAEPA